LVAPSRKKKTSLPSFASTSTCPPASSLPKRSSSLSGRFSSFWIRRSRGRAPFSGS